MKLNWGSGILMHITSLPSRYGIGDLGRSSRDFIDFLAAGAQRYWQFLPVTPGSPWFDNSPYMSFSAFAGNFLLIDPDQLVEEGLLDGKAVGDVPPFSEYSVEFEKIIPYKTQLLKDAFKVFRGAGTTKEFDRFCREKTWLDDYALYMSLREENEFKPWYEWPHDIAVRNEKTIKECYQRLSEQILYHKFVQFIFFKQWHRMWKYAARHKVSLIGDIPIYVALDSADVWAYQDCFRLDRKTLQSTHVAGVPPDYFSETGQRWGNPLFHWHTKDHKVKKRLYSWWCDRFRQMFKKVDIARIDHFRGFEAYWEIPAHEETAINGQWVAGPGKSFFDEMAKELGELPIIAEDLGFVTPEVERLRDDLGFPGMKVLQFAFDSDETNSYLPHNYTTANCVVYTGTHDNDTTVGWYLSDKVPQVGKDRAMRYGDGKAGDPVHWIFIRMAFTSIATVAIIPMQDVLGFGSDCRMNIPSTSQGNWRWRCAKQFLNEEISARLRDETVFCNRA